MICQHSGFKIIIRRYCSYDKPCRFYHSHRDLLTSWTRWLFFSVLVTETCRLSKIPCQRLIPDDLVKWLICDLLLVVFSLVYFLLVQLSHPFHPSFLVSLLLSALKKYIITIDYFNSCDKQWRVFLLVTFLLVWCKAGQDTGVVHCYTKISNI